MAREVAAKTLETAGDGTTTATVLAQAIANEGMKYVAAGLDPLEIKRGIDRQPDPHHRLRYRGVAEGPSRRRRSHAGVSSLAWR